MFEYVVPRLTVSVFTLLIVSLAIVGIAHFTPGDPARIMAGGVAIGIPAGVVAASRRSSLADQGLANSACASCRTRSRR